MRREEQSAVVNVLRPRFHANVFSGIKQSSMEPKIIDTHIARLLKKQEKSKRSNSKSGKITWYAFLFRLSKKGERKGERE